MNSSTRLAEHARQAFDRRRARPQHVTLATEGTAATL
jgi:hypothetical protein